MGASRNEGIRSLTEFRDEAIPLDGVAATSPVAVQSAKEGDSSSAPIDRPLTPEEARLTRWLLEHGKPEAAAFLPQLALVRVSGRCTCGCASIDFAGAGDIPPAAGMQILSDYEWQTADGGLFGVFVFACGGVLAGLEAWSIDGSRPASVLPAIEDLRPLMFGPIDGQV